jgi:uncharacterized membrane protein
MATDQIICPFCARKIKETDDFCPWCEKPLTTFATTDPLLLIRAQGQSMRGAVRRPTLFILVGVCVLCILSIVLCLVMVIAALFSLVKPWDEIIKKAIALVLCLFFAWVNFLIMRKVVRSYLAPRKEDGRRSKSDNR